jgi:hypothetical protein
MRFGHCGQGGEFEIEFWHVGDRLCCAGAWAFVGAAIDPAAGDVELFGGGVVVEEALGGVQEV